MKATKRTIGTVAVTALVALAAPAFARGGGGGGAGGMGANAGGMSESHISSQGSLNTNGPNATDRDTGLARAEDRANANADLSAKNKHGSLHGSARTDVSGSASTDRQ
jgi:hypothetical protein